MLALLLTLVPYAISICVDDGVEHSEGEKWVRNGNFLVTCAYGETKVLSCLTDAGTVLELGTPSHIENGVEYSCMDDEPMFEGSGEEISVNSCPDNADGSDDITIGNFLICCISKRFKERNELRKAVLEEGLPDPAGPLNETWRRVAQTIVRCAKETLCETKGGTRGDKSAWLWNEEVQAAVKKKKEDYKLWQKTMALKHLTAYRELMRLAKTAVAKAKNAEMDALYWKLDGPEGEKFAIRLAKARHRASLDIQVVNTVKSAGGRVLRKPVEVRERWEEYFRELLNEEFPRRKAQEEQPTEGPIPPWTQEAAWKVLGDRGINWLTQSLNRITKEGKMPDDWRNSTIAPIFKQKGDASEDTRLPKDGPRESLRQIAPGHTLEGPSREWCPGTSNHGHKGHVRRLESGDTNSTRGDKEGGHHSGGIPREDPLRTILYADDIALVADNQEELKEKEGNIKELDHSKRDARNFRFRVPNSGFRPFWNLPFRSAFLFWAGRRSGNGCVDEYGDSIKTGHFVLGRGLLKYCSIQKNGMRARIEPKGCFNGSRNDDVEDITFHVKKYTVWRQGAYDMRCGDEGIHVYRCYVDGKAVYVGQAWIDKEGVVNICK
ncbi:unnamed protein product [Heligmosomoides polygyrus]|uniref:Reverse transcriptase domain-containing protein n=1 Tax=Heligmosomoides polygyrus TaxID=6339 RepID=A0A3P8BDR9_HELPZ|nr:unnamed protein product [Heligmosomoides polygyrus]